jgi:hypothetical protein
MIRQRLGRFAPQPFPRVRIHNHNVGAPRVAAAVNKQQRQLTVRGRSHADRKHGGGGHLTHQRARGCVYLRVAVAVQAARPRPHGKLRMDAIYDSNVREFHVVGVDDGFRSARPDAKDVQCRWRQDASERVCATRCMCGVDENEMCASGTYHTESPRLP